MKIGCRLSYKIAYIIIGLACGYMILNIWITEKKAVETYTLTEKNFVMGAIIVFLSLIAHLIISGVFTQFYIYNWGMQIRFLGYEKKIKWEEFAVIRKYDHYFFFHMSKREEFFVMPYQSRFSFNISKQEDNRVRGAAYHPFTCFVIFDQSKPTSLKSMPISMDEFCELLDAYQVKYIK